MILPLLFESSVNSYDSQTDNGYLIGLNGLRVV